MADDKIVVLDDISHVLQRPSMYIGSTGLDKIDTWTLKDEKFTQTAMNYIPGLYKIVNEVIDNAVDENQRGHATSVYVGVSTDDYTYTVKDDGRGIPISKHESGPYVPEVVFTQLRSSSNFENEGRNVLGMNGVGASLTNIFSTKFIVEIHRDDKVYMQTFENNNKKINKPQVLNKKTKTSGTKVIFTPDYKIFKQKLEMSLIYKRCIELAYAFPELKLYLDVDGQVQKYSGTDFKIFCQYFGDKISFIEDTKAKFRLGLVASSTETFSHYSCVNGGFTGRGGTHITYVKEALTDKIRDLIKKEHKIEVPNIDIQKNLHIILFMKIEAPNFDSQTKECLTNEKSEIDKAIGEYFTSRKLNQLLDENKALIDQVVEYYKNKYQAKEMLELRKAQKDLKNKKIPKLIECSSRNRNLCTLFITEGDSALAGLSSVRDPITHAGIPLRGKVLNVSEMKARDILNNEEIKTLMSVIGLEFGKSPIRLVGGKPECDSLRYGNISLLTDADMDGISIRCLLVNFFFRYWPELFEHGFITISEAPLYEVTEKSTNKSTFFYEKTDFQAHIQNKNQNNLEISYYKGLGSGTKEAWNFFINEDPRKYKISIDSASRANLDKAFGKDVQIRKDWLK